MSARRFVRDGPAIPADVLHALDEDRLVFSCGAGMATRLRAAKPEIVEVRNTNGSSTWPAERVLRHTRSARPPCI